jgi:outer membrane receptor protein involved in Fe transport
MRLLRSLSSACLLLAAIAPSLDAQTARPGRVVGRVIDAGTGLGLSDVAIQIVGTKLGAMSGVDGRFTIAGITPGTVTVFARRIGFQPKTITGLFLDPGRTLEQNISLAAATVQLGVVTVSATAERGSVNEALDQQKLSLNVVNSVTSEVIAKSPDGNAAQAVQRVSGVTVQDGKYVFVRGLGERYTTSSLNGSRVPSPEPEKRVVPLDLFPSGLLQAITTTKTFTPDQPGDFSGAQVDIKTKEFPADRSYTVSLGTGYNAGATGKSVLGAATAGGERWAASGSERELPPLLRDVGNFQGLNLSQGDKNLLVSQFRNAWSPTALTAAPATSAAVSVGGNDPILFGQRLGYLLSGTFSSNTDVKDNQVRALADRGTTKGGTVEIDRFEGSTTTQNVLWGGLANLSTLIRDHHRFILNAMYNRSADNNARIERGKFENEGLDARILRMQYVERTVQSVQLGAEHSLADQHAVDWAVTNAKVRREEPDRSEFVQQIVGGTGGAETLRWLSTGNSGAVRTFSNLDESNSEARVNYVFSFGAAAKPHRIKLGGLVRATDRDADTRAYGIGAPGAGVNVTDLAPEQIFDGRFATGTSRVFDIAPLAQGGSYTARDRLSAAYLMADWSLTEKVKLTGGARAEQDRLDVSAFSTLGAPLAVSKQWDDLLPALALTWSMTSQQQVRFSVSRTLARPEYRELSPIKSRDVLNGDDTQGNDKLERTRVVNVDARWEWYPNSGETVSLAAFAKEFDQPIERVYRAAGSGTRTVFYLNADKARNLGVELEVRKSLEFAAAWLQGFSLFTNVTLMQSSIELPKESQASATNLKRRMVGQAPYVLNSGLTWVNQSGRASATILFNQVGDRIDAAGDAPLPDVIDRSRRVLDLSLRLPVFESVSVRMDAKNLLDSPYRTTQGTVTRETYRAGRTFTFGLSWKP